MSHGTPDTRLFPLDPSQQSQKEVLVHIRGSNSRGHASASELSRISVVVRSRLENLSGESVRCSSVCAWGVCVWAGLLPGGENISIRYPVGDI